MRAETHTCFNPLNPHDALKHNFTSLNSDLISSTLRFSDKLFKGTLLIITTYFFSFATHFKSSSFTAVVDENDNGKFRFERVAKKYRKYGRSIENQVVLIETSCTIIPYVSTTDSPIEC